MKISLLSLRESFPNSALKVAARKKMATAVHNSYCSQMHVQENTDRKLNLASIDYVEIVSLTQVTEIITWMSMWSFHLIQSFIYKRDLYEVGG